MTNNTQTDERQFSVIVNGLGYLNRIRRITPENGTPYLACDVVLKQGTNDYARFSCRILGTQAIETVRQYFTAPSGDIVMPKDKDGQKDATVMANVTLGGITPRLFKYKQGKNAGKTGVALHSVMLSFKWLKIGDDVVIKSEPGQPDANGTASQAAPAASGEPAYVAEMRAEFKRNGSVKLEKSHPEFEQRKAFLKDQGFKWDKQNMVWVHGDNASGASNGSNAGVAPAAPKEPPHQAVPVAVPEDSFWGWDVCEDLPF